MSEVTKSSPAISEKDCARMILRSVAWRSKAAMQPAPKPVIVANARIRLDLGRAFESGGVAFETIVASETG
ncbi:hypothetical protein D3C80_1367290 [compost metagenome]